MVGAVASNQNLMTLKSDVVDFVFKIKLLKRGKERVLFATNTPLVFLENDSQEYHKNTLFQSYAVYIMVYIVRCRYIMVITDIVSVVAYSVSVVAVTDSVSVVAVTDSVSVVAVTDSVSVVAYSVSVVAVTDSVSVVAVTENL